MYFHDKLISINTNLRKTWSVIKQVIHKKQTVQRISSMKDSPDTYSDPSQIATKFNNFFTNIRPSSANNIPPTQISHKQYLAGSYDNRYLLSSTSSEISSIALSLKNSKCEGYDNLRISPIKETIDLLAPPLSHILISLNIAYRKHVCRILFTIYIYTFYIVIIITLYLFIFIIIHYY